MTLKNILLKLKQASWLKKVGIAGFLFFLIKGLIWIGIVVWVSIYTIR